MKKLLVLTFIFWTNFVHSQIKDSVVYAAVPVDSLVIDAREFLQALKERNMGIKDFELTSAVLQQFLNYTADKRKKVIKKP